MRSVLALAVSISVLSALSLRAAADPAPDPPPSARPPAGAGDDCARARKAGKTCELTLAPEDVGGAAPGPGDVALRILALGRAGSLLHVRRDFIVEIVKSADDL